MMILSACWITFCVTCLGFFVLDVLFGNDAKKNRK
jgi:hypothetical protein